MRQAKVFVTQRHMIRGADGVWVDKYDLSSAVEYGELVYLASSRDRSDDTDNVLRKMEDHLSDFDDGDFLLLIGNPLFIGIATAVAAKFNGQVSFLQWSNRDKVYTPHMDVVIQDFGGEDPFN